MQRNYHHDAPVNDAVIHPNQGEIISCDQAGSVKIWDLGENVCTHELVPDEDVAIRTITIASDGGTLVAGNDHVSQTIAKASSHRLGHVLCLEDTLQFNLRGHDAAACDQLRRASQQIHNALYPVSRYEVSRES